MRSYSSSYDLNRLQQRATFLYKNNITQIPRWKPQQVFYEYYALIFISQFYYPT